MNRMRGILSLLSGNESLLRGFLLRGDYSLQRRGCVCTSSTMLTFVDS
jgi:hypothetical protein